MAQPALPHEQCYYRRLQDEQWCNQLLCDVQLYGLWYTGAFMVSSGTIGTSMMSGSMMSGTIGAFVMISGATSSSTMSGPLASGTTGASMMSAGTTEPP